MKARLPYSKKELRLMDEICDKRIRQEILRVQYMFMLAMNHILECDKEKLYEFIGEYSSIAKQFAGYTQDLGEDEADLKLIEALKQIDIEITLEDLRK
jgi:hypothetical protein